MLLADSILVILAAMYLLAAVCGVYGMWHEIVRCRSFPKTSLAYLGIVLLGGVLLILSS
jgi:hypothetical protein